MSDKKIKPDPLLDDQSKEPGQTAKPKVEAKVVKPVEKPAEPAKVSAKPEADKDTVAETKAILEKAPKVNFIIPMAEGEPVGSCETVQINRYKLTIQKGVMVNIPLPVANLLAEKYRIGMEAGREKRIDRASDVEDALS